MSEYRTLAAEHIREAQVRRGRAARYADRAHAAVFVAIERRGMTLFDIEPQSDVPKVLAGDAFELLKLDGIMGWLFNNVIRWALQKLIPIVLKWLHDAIGGWLDLEEPMRFSSERSRLKYGYSGAMRTLQPLFDEARRVLEGQR